jgi:hypothetical protein
VPAPVDDAPNPWFRQGLLDAIEREPPQLW